MKQIQAFIILMLIIITSSCEKEDPSGVPAPELFVGDWFSPGCITCCWYNLKVNEASNGSYFLDANATQSNGCRGFSKNGEVLFDSTNMVLWVDKHKIEIKNIFQSDSSWSSYNLDSGFWYMEANATGKSGGEVRTFYKETQ
ncbi:MAG: hypothetical protein MRY83_08725 [Flavobacteriales bacterium]|nr:hypothetical protein [Flavobacteriales bacterium]